MKRSTVITTILTIFTMADLVAQQSEPHPSVQVQPVIWMDGILPSYLTAIAFQYEHPVHSDHAIIPRIAWFREPFTGEGKLFGVTISTEYRYYFHRGPIGWHVGPFADLNRYKFQRISSSGFGFDAGVLIGHKWITSNAVFDLSARVAAYSHEFAALGRYFPKASTRFNSHLLISIGVSL